MKKILNWSHRLDEVPESPRTYERVATAQQCKDLAEAFDLLDCEGLQAQYQLMATAGGDVELKGTLQAQGHQSCVVTLEPVPFALEEDIMVRFVPDHAVVATDPDVEHEALAVDDVEPYSGTVLNVGDVLFEHFGAALNPYPRVPGTALEGCLETGGNNDQTTHPFAQLKKLKSNS